MISSMTAFARQEIQAPWGSLVWEIRSVNHRYLEVQCRLPENLRDLEPKLREALRSKLARGKVEVGLFFRAGNEAGEGVSLNADALDQLDDAISQVRNRIEDTAPINVIELLRWPGVLQTQDPDFDQIKADALSAFADALSQLKDMRRTEGAALADMIQQRLDALTEIVAQVRERMPDIMAQQQQRLRDKIEQIAVDADPGRLEQEMAIILQRADIDEELDRLQTHIGEVTNTLSQKGAIGRRLDFLMQELNREANTLSSKSADSGLTQAGVELKVLIEQMREQVQNIE